MDHPAIKEMELTGFAPGESEPETHGTDALGNDVFKGDEVYELGNDIFAVEQIGYDARQILELIGADKTTA